MKTRLVHGVGVNNADYIINSKSDGLCPIYSKWAGMIERCYSKKYQATRPTYVGCSVVPEWLAFMGFRDWMVSREYKGKHLDKDILFYGNKVYGPDTCVLVTSETNNFVLDSGRIRGDSPIGVFFHNRDGKYVSKVKFDGRQISLGYFDTKEEAHLAWATEKLRLAKELAAKQTDTRVALALVTRYEAVLNKAKQTLNLI